MSVKLTLQTTPTVPLEAEVITPDKLAGLKEAEIAKLTVQHGNEPAALGDFFKVSGAGNDEVQLEGDLTRIKLIGSGMTGGRLRPSSWLYISLSRFFRPMCLQS